MCSKLQKETKQIQIPPKPSSVKYQMENASVEREKLSRIIKQVIKIASSTQPQMQCSHYLKKRHFHYSEFITQKPFSIQSKECYYRAEHRLFFLH